MRPLFCALLLAACGSEKVESTDGQQTKSTPPGGSSQAPPVPVEEDNPIEPTGPQPPIFTGKLIYAKTDGLGATPVLQELNLGTRELRALNKKLLKPRALITATTMVYWTPDMTGQGVTVERDVDKAQALIASPCTTTNGIYISATANHAAAGFVCDDGTGYVRVHSFSTGETRRIDNAFEPELEGSYLFFTKPSVVETKKLYVTSATSDVAAESETRVSIPKDSFYDVSADLSAVIFPSASTTKDTTFSRVMIDSGETATNKIPNAQSSSFTASPDGSAVIVGLTSALHMQLDAGVAVFDQPNSWRLRDGDRQWITYDPSAPIAWIAAPGL